jgi:hybrid cluster-associated redox disulfide protein
MNMAEKAKFNKDMTIMEAIKQNPAVGGVLTSKGMHCLGCAVAHGETLEQAAEVHSLNLKELMKELNALK